MVTMNRVNNYGNACAWKQHMIGQMWQKMLFALEPSSAQIVCHTMWYVLVVTLTLNYKGYKFALIELKKI